MSFVLYETNVTFYPEFKNSFEVFIPFWLKRYTLFTTIQITIAQIKKLMIYLKSAQKVTFGTCNQILLTHVIYFLIFLDFRFGSL